MTRPRWTRRDNLEAGFGELPDANSRARMVAFIRAL